MKTYLVTGGCGFIGANFIRYILETNKDVNVINIDKITYCGNMDNLKDFEGDARYKFYKLDICDEFSIKSILLQTKPDYVINFAAESHVDNSISGGDEFIKTNISGVNNLLKQILYLVNNEEYKIKRFVQISTDEVYGSVDKPSKETDLLNPSSLYSASKAGGEFVALSYYKTHGLPVVITRSSNNYGPYQYPEKVIPLFITNLLRDKQIPLYGNGLNKRDWLYVEDNCKAIDIVAQRGVNGEIYNIGTHQSDITNLKLTNTLLKLLGKDSESIVYVKDRLGHDFKYAVNSKKIREFGWKPEVRFNNGIKRTINWYKNNEEWWTKLNVNK